MGIDKNPIQSGSQSGRKAFCNNFAVFAVYTVIVTLLHFVCITGRCCKRQHLVQPTTLGLWGPSGISVGTDVICSYTQPSLFLYTAQFVLIHSPFHTSSDLHMCSHDVQLFNPAPPADFGTLIKQTETCVEHVKA